MHVAFPGVQEVSVKAPLRILTYPNTLVVSANEIVFNLKTSPEVGSIAKYLVTPEL